MAPMGIAVDGAGQHLRVRHGKPPASAVIAPDGTATLFAGGDAGGCRRGPALDARFNQPAGLALPPDGALLVADLGNGVIRRIDLAAPGNLVTTLHADKWLYRPSALAVAPDGTLYIVETGMARVVA